MRGNRLHNCFSIPSGRRFAKTTLGLHEIVKRMIGNFGTGIFGKPLPTFKDSTVCQIEAYQDRGIPMDMALKCIKVLRRFGANRPSKYTYFGVGVASGRSYSKQPNFSEIPKRRKK